MFQQLLGQFSHLLPHSQRQLWLNVLKFLTRCFLKGWSYFQAMRSLSSSPLGKLCFTRKWNVWKYDIWRNRSKTDKKQAAQKRAGDSERPGRGKKAKACLIDRGITWGRSVSHWTEWIWSLTGCSSCTMCSPPYPVHKHTHTHTPLCQMRSSASWKHKTFKHLETCPK